MTFHNKRLRFISRCLMITTVVTTSLNGKVLNASEILDSDGSNCSAQRTKIVKAESGTEDKNLARPSLMELLKSSYDHAMKLAETEEYKKQNEVTGFGGVRGRIVRFGDKEIIAE